MATVAKLLDRVARGSGTAVTVQGPPGVGKTRLLRETMVTARRRGFDTFVTYSESHTREIAFHVISRLLRAVLDIGGLPLEQARSRVRSAIPFAGAEDLVLLDDLLGVRDDETPVPDVSPDARRRRLVEIISAIALARTEPAVYVIEDAQWIDAVSEAMLAEFVASLPRMRALLLIAYRPEYRGALSRVPGVTAFDIAPLSDSHIFELLGELLGDHPSVRGLSAVIAERAAGVPFCAEEIVRDLAERDELQGAPGAYVCAREVSEIHVPASLQAIIGSRIDRLSAVSKRMLHAAAVIGARFDTALLALILDTTPDAVDLTPLIEAQLVELVPRATRVEYAFGHPLIQAVAYESQLKASRSELHRRVAAVMQRTRGGFTGEEAGIVATQYAAAGDLRDAFDWYMHAATWYGARDIRAARQSWQCAQRVADLLPPDQPDVLSMRIAPRALLCGSTFQVGGTPADTGFAELRELTSLAGDKKSLVVGMAGHLTTLTFHSQHREAAEMASEFVTLVESIGDPAMTVGLLYAAAQAKWEAGEAAESLRLAQRVIDLADGDPTMGNLLIGSPLAWALTVKGAAGMFLGRKGWRDDLRAGIVLARSVDAAARSFVQLYKYVAAIQNRAVQPNERDLALAAESLEVAQQSGDNAALAYALLNRAIALLHNNFTADGLDYLGKAKEMFETEQLPKSLRRICDIEFARGRTRSGDIVGAIELARAVITEQFDRGEMIFRGPATAALVEALLARGSEGDLDEARRAIDRLAAVPNEPGFVVHELAVLRMRALLARARGDGPACHTFVQQLAAKAREAEFDGYLAQARQLAGAGPVSPG